MTIIAGSPRLILNGFHHLRRRNNNNDNKDNRRVPTFFGTYARRSRLIR